MSIKLTYTQLVLLSAVAQRKDLCLVAAPTLKGATAQKVASRLRHGNCGGLEFSG